MMGMQMTGGNASQVMTSDFGFAFQPGYDGIGHGAGDCLGLTNRRADAQTGGNDTGMQFIP